jgi:hypothetical protein
VHGSEESTHTRARGVGGWGGGGGGAGDTTRAGGLRPLPLLGCTRAPTWLAVSTFTAACASLPNSLMGIWAYGWESSGSKRPRRMRRVSTRATETSIWSHTHAHTRARARAEEGQGQPHTSHAHEEVKSRRTAHSGQHSVHSTLYTAHTCATVVRPARVALSRAPPAYAASVLRSVPAFRALAAASE